MGKSLTESENQEALNTLSNYFLAVLYQILYDQVSLTLFPCIYDYSMNMLQNIHLASVSIPRPSPQSSGMGQKTKQQDQTRGFSLCLVLPEYLLTGSLPEWIW